ncbi:PaaI family thioesterase [Maritimibacter dapengensis]|uniref:PaaI family thioesterase n=1 Tax=Maritimibacter dapengensis TaxID=2836868 RepID=A0ABS6SYQ3_9RHOB|nr:PaaI family thioesterase [Maritimibacter dapengensis]MBV7378109.1 PaaI family thioesterase [Maritimibacter dapengensis]
MMETLGAALTDVTPGSVTITSSIPPGTLQQQGSSHAGLAFSIGDSAAGYSALSLMPAHHEVVTSEMKIHLLAPGRGDRLVAIGRVLKPGRRLMITEADVWAEAGETRILIAKLLGTMVPVPLEG